MIYSSKFKLVLRLVSVPIVFLLVFIAHTFHAFKRTWLFIKYGGEFANYERNDDVTMQDIYKELKQNKK